MTQGQWLVLVLSDIERRVGKHETFELTVATLNGMEYTGSWKQHGSSVIQIGDWYIDMEKIVAIKLGDPL